MADILVTSLRHILTPAELVAIQQAAVAPVKAQLDAALAQVKQLQQQVADLTAQLAACTGPAVPPVVHPGGVPSFQYKNGVLSGLAAPYVTHYGGHTAAKTIADKKKAVDFIASMGRWNGVMLSVYQTEDDGLPKYIQSKKLDWWINYINGPWKELSYEAYKTYIAKVFGWGGVGAVIDDAQNFTPDQMEAMIAPIPADKPVIASYSSGYNVTDHLARVPRLLIARQLFRHGETDPAHPEEAGTHVANQLKSLTHVATLEAYRAGSSLATPAELTAMFNACQAAGVVNHAPYTEWETNNWNWQTEPEPAKTLSVCMNTFWTALRR